MSEYPQWFNAERASELVSLFAQFGNKCLLGHKVCSNPEHYIAHNSKGEIVAQRLYDRVVADKVADFKDEDKALWHRERRKMHDLGEPARYYRGRWNAIAKDIYYTQQPTYVFKGLGVSAVTFKPIAKIRISSSYWYLYIDIPIDRAFKTVSKNAKRKAIRYNKLDSSVSDSIDSIINHTVSNYINS
jgi:hypothetical protein